GSGRGRRGGNGSWSGNGNGSGNGRGGGNGGGRGCGRGGGGAGLVEGRAHVLGGGADDRDRLGEAGHAARRARIVSSVPLSNDRYSIVALSVSTSARRSSIPTASPSFLCQTLIWPSSMVGESFGMSRILAMVARLRGFCRGQRGPAR